MTILSPSDDRDRIGLEGGSLDQSEDVEQGGPSVNTIPRWLRLGGRIAILGQLGVLLAWSAFLYSHFDLIEDFGIEAQAWHQIGHGNLDPNTTIYGYPFIQNNMQLYMWPLAIVGRFLNNAILLVLLQDVCLAIAAWVAWQWWCDMAERRRVSASAGILGASALVLVVLVVSPVTYLAASFDFHSECVAAPLFVLVGYDLWQGRTRRALVWAVLLLVVHSLGASYLVAMAVAAILVGKGATRRMGGALLGLAVAWTLLMSAVGGVNEGSGYDYLTGGNPTTVTGSAVIVGALTHLHAVLDVIRSRLSSLGRIVTSTGTLGLFCVWGLVPAIIVIGPAALNSSPAYVSGLASFQVVPLVGPMAVASGWVALELFRRVTSASMLVKRPRARHVGPAVALSLMLAAMLGVGLSAVRQYPTWRSWSAVSGGAAAALGRAQAKIPSDAEVVVVSGVSGRFYPARSLFILVNGSTRFPVCSPRVAFVLTDQGMEGLIAPTLVAAANTVVDSELHARRLVEDSGVNVYLWDPPRGARSFNLDPETPAVLSKVCG